MWVILFRAAIYIKRVGWEQNQVLWKVDVVEEEGIRNTRSGKPDSNMTCGEEREGPGHLTAGHPEVKLIHHSLHHVPLPVNQVCSLLLSHCSRLICDWLALPKQEITLQVLLVRNSRYPKLKQHQMWIQLPITVMLPFKVKDHCVCRCLCVWPERSVCAVYCTLMLLSRYTSYIW